MTLGLFVACGDASLLTRHDEGSEGTSCSDATGIVTSGLTSGRSSTNALPQPGTLVSALDGFAVYDESIDSTKHCGGTELREGVQAVAAYLARFGIIGKSYRGCQTGFHPVGQALDVYLDGSTVNGLRPFADWLTANGGEMARRLGVVQIFFNSRIWRSYDGGPGRPQGVWSRYNGADPHTGHIHVSFSEEAARGNTSFFSEVIRGEVAPSGAQQVTTGLPSFVVAAQGLWLSSVGNTRLLDTRASGALAPGEVRTAFTSAEVGGAEAVSLGVALVAPEGDSFLSVAGGSGISPTSTVNARAGTVRANQTIVSLASGVVSMRSLQRTDVVIDAQARFGRSGAGFQALGPARVLDTRGGDFLKAGQVRTLSLAPVGVPASAVAAQLGLAVIPRGAAGFLSVIGCGDAVETSSVNFDGAQVASSSALGAVRGGSVCLFSNVDADVVVDVAGFYDAGGASLSLVEPARVLDTRSGEGGWLGMPTAGQVLRLELSSMPGWQGSSAVAFNLTVVDGMSQGFARVWDCTGDPTHSNVNATPGEAVGTFGVVRSTGSLCVMTQNPQHLILDLVGVYR